MANTLASIGFDFTDPAQFQERMLELAAGAIERLSCPPGDYAIWRSRTGAEIWFHLGVFGTEDDARDIHGLTPFFEGASDVAVEITERVQRPDDNPFEGQLVARLCLARRRADQPDAPVAGTPADTRFTFDAIDFAAHADRPLPFVCQARLVALASSIRTITVGEPAGVFSTTRLSGETLEIRRLQNEASGGRFVALVLDCAGTTIDVVAEAGLVPGDLEPGAAIEVDGRLFGRLMD